MHTHLTILKKYEISTIQQFKTQRAERDKLAGANHYDNANRWVGAIGEDLFEQFCKIRGWDYTKQEYRPTRDLYDFAVREKFVDVKTFGRNRRPTTDDWCGVIEAQIGHTGVDTYVFVSFVYSTNQAYLHGWLSKVEFIKMAKSYKKGQRVSFDFVTPIDTRLVQIKQLRLFK